MFATTLSAQVTISGITLEDVKVVTVDVGTTCDLAANLVGWWDATVGITEDVGVTTWEDQSGNGYNWTQNVDNYEPTLTSS
jgi:hypothetical protein